MTIVQNMSGQTSGGNSWLRFRIEQIAEFYQYDETSEHVLEKCLEHFKTALKN